MKRIYIREEVNHILFKQGIRTRAFKVWYNKNKFYILTGIIGIDIGLLLGLIII